MNLFDFNKDNSTPIWSKNAPAFLCNANKLNGYLHTIQVITIYADAQKCSPPRKLSIPPLPPRERERRKLTPSTPEKCNQQYAENNGYALIPIHSDIQILFLIFNNITSHLDLSDTVSHYKRLNRLSHRRSVNRSSFLRISVSSS